LVVAQRKNESRHYTPSLRRHAKNSPYGTRDADACTFSAQHVGKIAVGEATDLAAAVPLTLRLPWSRRERWIAVIIPR